MFLWVIFLSLLVGLFLKNLTLEKGLELAHLQGVDFTEEEGEIILPFLKENAYIVDVEHKDELLTKIEKKLDKTSFYKVKMLIEKII